MSGPVIEDGDAGQLQLARFASAANALLRTGVAESAVRAWYADQIHHTRLMDLVMALTRMVPADRTPERLLGWTVEQLPVGERPSWYWAPQHAIYVDRSGRGFTDEQMPGGVVEGERLFWQAVYRERYGLELPAAS